MSNHVILDFKKQPLLIFISIETFWSQFHGKKTFNENITLFLIKSSWVKISIYERRFTISMGICTGSQRKSYMKLSGIILSITHKVSQVLNQEAMQITVPERNPYLLPVRRKQRRRTLKTKCHLKSYQRWLLQELNCLPNSTVLQIIFIVIDAF